MRNTQTNTSQGQASAGNAVVLTASNVSVAFKNGNNSVQVTRDVSFEVSRGQTLALVGESGSGKSVTAMSILKLLPGNAHATGSIKFHDEELVDASEARIRALRGRKIGVIFQEPMTALNPVYTIGDMIKQALQSQRKRSGDDAHERTLELLRLVGMPEPERRVAHYPHQLSGGQRQRAMIALAISGDPELLIADEPTTALDVTVQADILALLKSLQERFGMAMIFITHDMGVVAEVADRVCVMRDGAVVEEADVYSLFAAPQELYTRELLASVPRLGATEVKERGAPVEDNAPVAALNVQSLSVRYPGRFRSAGFLAIDEVSFQVPPGEIVGLVGESGSGKSTIGRAVIGLAPISAGTVAFAGQDLAGLNSRQWKAVRRDLSIVFQDPASSLNPRATIGQSIVEPLARHKLLAGRKELRARSKELLDLVRLPPTWLDRYPHELSGGQRQRVGIARAISLKPKVLIADEPTSALDVSVQKTVLEIFQELQSELGFSCLFISHDLAVVEMLANKVVVLRQGKIVEQGTGTRLLRQPEEEYTRRLLSAAPVPEPTEQKRRAKARRMAS